ncbi:hypothetical protein, partial [Enterobacter hormaechei]|uniref:hypothetical protein n=1 Tax=Enterobacter hormaechei TaxID=158836 RepID=UPI0019531182
MSDFIHGHNLSDAFIIIKHHFVDAIKRCFIVAGATGSAAASMTAQAAYQTTGPTTAPGSRGARIRAARKQRGWT